MPKNFSWKRYKKIINQFGSIQKYGNSEAWYYIEFSEECKRTISGDYPNSIFLCKETYNNSQIYEDGFYNILLNQEELIHPTLKQNVKLIDSEKLAQALAYVVYGNSPKEVHSNNDNFEKLGLPKNTFIIPLEKNYFDYIDFRVGEIIYKISKTKEKTDILVYRTEPPSYD